MWESILVAGLILLAAAYTIYRTFFAPSCGCDKGDGKSCCSGASLCTQSPASKAASGPCASPCGPELNTHCPCSKALLDAPARPRNGK